MIKPRFYFTIFVLLLCSYIGSSKLAINGVSHLCHNPDGRLGRCTSMAKCHHHVDCDRNASSWPCSNGHGRPPHVCCVFGTSIVFPDSDDVDVNTSGPRLKSRNLASESPNRGAILYPDENGNFNIPTSLPVAKVRQGVADKKDLFPRPPVCGPMTLGDKIHGGVEAQLGEFPWLVNLEYRTDDGELQIACSGNILNHRYVLTAAHCVKGDIEELVGKLESMRVGDHNTASARDCDDLGCIDPFERFGIVESMVHNDYFYTKKGRMFNDIALLKTDRSITYSYSVAPICLPTVMGSLEPPVAGARLTVAGWGDSGPLEFTDEKRIVDVPYVDSGICPFRVDPTQMCAGGETGKDSCTGDSGGSLARRTTRSWVMEGMVSYGRGCGTIKPAIYTRIRNFIQWIEDHIEEA